MGAIHVSISHDDNFMVAQLFQIKFAFSNTGTKGCHQLLYFL